MNNVPLITKTVVYTIILDSIVTVKDQGQLIHYRIVIVSVVYHEVTQILLDLILPNNLHDVGYDVLPSMVAIDLF